MFIGKYFHSLDEKKRLAVPSKFRKEIKNKKAIITRGIDNCLSVYPLKEWANLAKKLSSLPNSQVEARGFARLMLAGAMDVTLDSLGRILIPDYLKNYAFLKKNTAIIGLCNKFEIWDEKIWHEYEKQTETTVGDIAEKLKELGI